DPTLSRGQAQDASVPVVDGDIRVAAVGGLDLQPLAAAPRPEAPAAPDLRLAQVGGGGVGTSITHEVRLTRYDELARTTSSRERPVVHNPETGAHGQTYAAYTAAVLAGASPAEMERFAALRQEGLDPLAAGL